MVFVFSYFLAIPVILKLTSENERMLVMMFPSLRDKKWAGSLIWILLVPLTLVAMAPGNSLAFKNGLLLLILMIPLSLVPFLFSIMSYRIIHGFKASK